MKYRYYIGVEEVFPLNKDDLKYNYEKKIESGVIFEKVLETSLIFNYQSGNFNFKDREKTDKCVELEFRVDKKCGISYETFFEGGFSIVEGNFDDDTCKYTIKVRPRREILEDVEVNILQTPGRIPGGVSAGAVNFPNALYFEDAILYVAKKSNPKINSVISNLFQINPDGPVYLPNLFVNLGFGVQYLVFCALSDIQYPLPSNIAQLEIVKFKDLMDDLQVLFSVQYLIDENYNLRIEHEIWFEGSVGLDLTQSKYRERLLAFNKYSYVLDDYPKEEVWKIINHSQSSKLVYSGVSSVKKNKNSKVYQTRLINTDYQQRLLSGGSDRGLFLFICDSNYDVTFDNTGYLNGGLSPTKLIKTFHTYNRPSIYSILESFNNDPTLNQYGGLVLDSYSPTKKQVEISIPLCCGDEFNTEEQILTEMGTGYLEKASFETKSNLLRLELKYKVNTCSDFEPSDLSGLALWLKHNDVVKVGTGVSQWNDSSGNNRHAVQGVAGLRPTQAANNDPIYFDAIKYLTTPAFQLFPNKRGTIIVLMSFAFNPPATGISILSTDDGTLVQHYDLSLNLNYNFISANEGIIYPRVIEGGGSAGLRIPGLFIVNRIENTFININQNNVNPTTNPATNSDTQPASLPLIIGANANNIPGETSFFRISEVIIYDRSLTDLEQEKINFYFVKKGIYNIYPPLT